jgi:hypothetical protein
MYDIACQIIISHCEGQLVLMRSLEMTRTMMKNIVIIYVFLTVSLPVVCLAEANSLAVPADFDRLLTLPGESNQFLRPSAMTLDSHHDEILIADAGHNRVLIFDKQGIFRFEIQGGDVFSTPVDIAVDSQGLIYILASSREGRRIYIHDFDGLAMGVLPLPYSGTDSDIEAMSMAFDDDDHLYVTDKLSDSIRVFDTQGREINSWKIEETMDEDEFIIMGRITVHDYKVLMPLATSGTVHLYDTDGTLLKKYGHKGNNTGELIFPVSAELNRDGMVMVLDKHRFNVVCFAEDGRFVGEFGGKGMSLGWFYHPSLLVDLGDQGVLIGQVYNNWVQVCRIPDSILNRNAGS